MIKFGPAGLGPAANAEKILWKLFKSSMSI